MMTRIHLFEFMDLPWYPPEERRGWYPQVFRRMQADYLQFVATLNAGYKHLVPLFRKALQSADTTEIVDLCSGGTSPWIRLREQLRDDGLNITVKLTDKYPNPEAVQRWEAGSLNGIEYLAESVDAMDVPPHLTGMRTLFEGFHHFKPAQARAILQDAFEKRNAIGIFEASLKPPFGFLLLLLSPLVTTLSYFVMTPLMKPRTLARFLWTYFIPVVPLTTSWDGVLSLLRVYSPAELQKLIGPLQSEDYCWEIGLASTGTPIFDFITYLVGYPLGKK